MLFTYSDPHPLLGGGGGGGHGERERERKEGKERWKVSHQTLILPISDQRIYGLTSV